MSDLDELERLARGATPGPWTVHQESPLRKLAGEG